MSTCRRTKIAFLFCTLGLLLITPNTLTIVAAQTDDFPIGLRLVYNDKWTSGGIGMPYTSTDSIEFQFVQWVDESQSIVEIKKDETAIQTAFPDGSIDVGSGVPLWVDTSQWSDGIAISFQGQSYNVTATKRTVEAGVYNCWELTYHSFQSSIIHYYYDRNLGFLIIYISTTYHDITFNQQVYELTDSNLDEFIVTQLSLIDFALVLGVIVEICIILYLCFRRNKS